MSDGRAGVREKMCEVCISGVEVLFFFKLYGTRCMDTYKVSGITPFFFLPKLRHWSLLGNDTTDTTYAKTPPKPVRAIYKRYLVLDVEAANAHLRDLKS